MEDPSAQITSLLASRTKTADTGCMVWILDSHLHTVKKHIFDPVPSDRSTGCQKHPYNDVTLTDFQRSNVSSERCGRSTFGSGCAKHSM